MLVARSFEIKPSLIASMCHCRTEKESCVVSNMQRCATERGTMNHTHCLARTSCVSTFIYGRRTETVSQIEVKEKMSGKKSWGEDVEEHHITSNKRSQMCWVVFRPGPDFGPMTALSDTASRANSNPIPTRRAAPSPSKTFLQEKYNFIFGQHIFYFCF